jgi:hypothetical protein
MALEIEIGECVGDSLRTLFPNPHDPESAFFLLKTVEIRIELERKDRIAEIARLFSPFVIVCPQHLPEMFLYRVGERRHVMTRRECHRARLNGI